MQVIIPAAGEGSRFFERGYLLPKPFLPLLGTTLVDSVIDNVSNKEDSVYVILQAKHALRGISSLCRDNVLIKLLSSPTVGAVNTVLTVKTHVNTKEPVTIANCDQYVIYDRSEWDSLCRNSDVAIMTFTASSPKWSYIKKDSYGKAVEVADKKAISNEAIVGIYYFNCYDMFVEYSHRLISNEDNMYRGEFYIGGVLDMMIQDGTDVKTLPVEMYGLGTPEDYIDNKRVIESFDFYT